MFIWPSVHAPGTLVAPNHEPEYTVRCLTPWKCGATINGPPMFHSSQICLLIELTCRLATLNSGQGSGYPLFQLQADLSAQRRTSFLLEKWAAAARTLPPNCSSSGMAHRSQGGSSATLPMSFPGSTDRLIMELTSALKRVESSDLQRIEVLQVALQNAANCMAMEHNKRFDQLLAVYAYGMAARTSPSGYRAPYPLARV
jgi:hypothetical protein